MRLPIGIPAVLGLLLAAGAGLAQVPGDSQPWPGSAGSPRQGRPVLPRPATPQSVPPLAVASSSAQLQPPFQLTPQQAEYLDRVLQAWERRSAGVKTFACKFTRWEYDPVYPTNADSNRDPMTTPVHTDEGEIRYGRPDRGMFRVLYTEQNGQMVPVGDDRAAHWVCDGKSIYEYKPQEKQLIEHKLPPNLWGKAIADGPLPFLFGAEAAKLKQRYFLRIIAPPEAQREQIWLQAFPRWQQDAADFARAELILNLKDLTPYGLQIVFPNGKTRHAYQFYDIVTNDPLGFLKGDPFHARTPLGWQKVVEEAPPTRVSQQPTTGASR